MPVLRPIVSLLNETPVLSASEPGRYTRRRRKGKKGASRFSIVTSRRSVRKGAEFAEILRVISSTRDAGLQAFCSPGLITATQAREPRRSGVSQYHANIETAPSYFSHICSTFRIDDKIGLTGGFNDLMMRPLDDKGKRPVSRHEEAPRLRPKIGLPG